MPPAPPPTSQAAVRAVAAADAVTTRHLRRVWGVPGTALGVVGWPPTLSERAFGRWHFWWQAHLLDCLVDAETREASAAGVARIRALARGHRLRNLGLHGNAYYDDIAWWGLALLRARTRLRSDPVPVVDGICRRLTAEWSDEHGGIPWRRGDVFRNAPANAPAALLWARRGYTARAGATLDWIHRRLRPGGGPVVDGLRPAASEPDGYLLHREVYSYSQGVVIAAELELVRSVGRAPDRLHELVDVVATALTDDRGVLRGHGGGNGGLFTGILVRHLARVALELPGDDDAARRTRGTAARLVHDAADALWQHRATDADGRPVFGPDWSSPARLPRGRGAPRTATGARIDASPEPERDLSVQLAGWTALEAAAALAAGGAPSTAPIGTAPTGTPPTGTAPATGDPGPR